MGIHVKLPEAAQLVGRHERIVRWHLGRGDFPGAVKQGRAWRIDIDDLERIPGWTVDRGRLAELEAQEGRTPGGILARLASIERELDAMKTRLRLVESQVRQGRAADALPDALGWPTGGASASPYRLSYPQADAVESRHTAPHAGILTASPPRPVSSIGAGGVLPPDYVTITAYSNLHGLSDSHPKDLMKAGRIPNAPGGPWRVPNERGALVSRASWALDAEGRRIFHEVFPDRASPNCEECRALGRV